ncbi:MAG: hypothetical protein WAL95_21780 [Candidatus Acidiferrales bacterium]
MKAEVLIHLTIADQVWVATALLHREHPERADFSKQEIQQCAQREYPEGARRPGMSQHISTHCVASNPPSPAKHRMLTRTGNGRRRLFRSEDKYHPLRAKGNATPQREDLPEKYHPLLHWYETEYDRREKPEDAGAKSGGATPETLMKLMGRISREDADEMIRAIDDCCGRVDANEW